MTGETLAGWEAFVRFVKDEFGHEVILKESAMPDSFETIFGESFLAQNEEMDTIKCVYSGESVSVALTGAVGDWYAMQDIFFAA